MEDTVLWVIIQFYQKYTTSGSLRIEVLLQLSKFY